MSKTPRQGVAVCVAFALATSGCGSCFGTPPSSARHDAPVARDVASPNPSAPPAAGPLDRQTLEETIAVVKNASAPLLGAQVGDVDRKADEIGPDPSALFAHVRDNVHTEIYAGVLRGPRSTLTGQAGNAWDKALLLAAMLRHHGREVRFARAHLAPDAAASVVARMFDDARRPRVSARAALDIPASIQARSRAVLAAIDAGWRREHSETIGALDRARIAVASSPPTPESTLAAEAADHVWIEYRDGDRWIPLDAVAASRAGEAVATATETLAAVPDSLYHRVTVHVKVESRRGQVLEAKDALTFRTTAAALNGVPVILTHRIDQTPFGRWRARPMLTVDRQTFSARSFTDTGVEPAKKAAAIVGEASQQLRGLGRVTDVFGSAPSPAVPPPASSELTAVWVDVEFIDPGGRAETVHRDIFDRVGMVSRAEGRASTAAVAPIPMIGSVPGPLAGVYACTVTAGAVEPAAVLERIALRPDAIETATAPTAPGGGGIGSSPRLRAAFQSLPTLLWASAAATHALSQRLLAGIRPSDGSQVLFFEATPRLAIASLDLQPSKDASHVTASFALDLRRNGLRVVARGAGAQEAARLNLARGVLDAVIEDAIGQQVASAFDPIPASTVAILARARTDGIASSAFGGGTDAIRKLALPDEVRARMSAASGGTTAIVTPMRAVSLNDVPRAGWWQIDLQSGETLGMLENGLHGTDMTELAEIEEIEEEDLAWFDILPVGEGPITDMYEASRYGSWLPALVVGAILGVVLALTTGR